MIAVQRRFCLHAVFLLVTLVNSQNDYINSSTNKNVKLPSITTNKTIDVTTQSSMVSTTSTTENELSNSVEQEVASTFVSPVEALIQNIPIHPLNLLGKFTKGKAAKGSFSELLNLINNKFKGIYPGTAWCGSGNIASSENELGIFAKTDTCCRTHDLCKISMNAGESKSNLLNNGMFTRSHCECDSKFLNCLRKARSLVATKIGFTYFTILRPQCFKEEYPAHCIKRSISRPVNRKCISYKFDKTQKKKWQWFDNPDF